MAGSKHSSENSVRKEKDNTHRHVEVQATERRGEDRPELYEKNALRSYGDDEDHDHEPPVRCTRRPPMPLLQHSGADFSVDVPPQDHELGSHGFPLDWQSNSRLHLR